MQKKRKIRILHVAQAAGGVNRYLKELLKYLDHDRFENVLVCSQDYRAADYETLADYIEIVPMQRAIGGNDLKAAAALRRQIRIYHPDLIYAHSSKAGAIARLANMGMNTKLIYNPHGWAFEMKCSAREKWIYQILEQMMSPFTDKIICISETEAEAARLHHICREQKLQLIVNGIDLQETEVAEQTAGREASEEAEITRRMLKIPEDAFVVGMVGRLSRQKAPDIFIRMAEKIREKIPDAHFLLVGDGEMRDQVEAYALEHGFNFFLHITGWVDRPLDYVKLFDAAVILSRWEGFGLAIPEYMFCRKPVTAAAVGAIPTIIRDHENGLLVPEEDPEAAAAAVLEIYRNPDLRDRMVEQGSRDVYEKYDMRRTAKEHEALFLKLAGSDDQAGKDHE